MVERILHSFQGIIQLVKQALSYDGLAAVSESGVTIIGSGIT